MAYESQYPHVPLTKYECLLFDLDDTIYSHSYGFSNKCTKNIEDYMIQKLGMEESEVSKVGRVLYKNYGTTMAGLKAVGYDFDNDDYHSFVHGRLPYKDLQADPVLRNLLLSLPIRKVIFSNADKIHVTKVLRKLGLEDCFDGIVNFESLNPTDKTSNNFDGKGLVCIRGRGSSTEILDATKDCSVLPKSPIVCKPFEDAFEQAFKLANINPHKTLFFDDSFRNIESAKSLGLHTVLVGTSQRTNGADYALESIHNIREALPELWEADKISRSIKCSENVAIETSVTA